MPLSADSILGFFDSTTRRCEVFEHVSFVAAAPTTTTVTPPLCRFHGTPVSDVEGAGLNTYNNTNTTTTNTFNGKSSNGNGGPARTIPKTTSGIEAPSSNWGAETSGTLYICALPEMMWNSIVAVTATTALSQRQLAFSNEAPAFCVPCGQSFVQGGREFPQSMQPKIAAVEETRGTTQHNGRNTTQARNTRLVEEELREISAFGAADDFSDDTRTPPRHTHTAKRHTTTTAAAARSLRHSDPISSEDRRYQVGLQDQLHSHTALSPSQLFVWSGGGDSNGIATDENEGIRLPDMVPNMRQQFSSSIFCTEGMVPGAELKLPQPPRSAPSLMGLNAHQAANIAGQRPPSPVTAAAAGLSPTVTASSNSCNIENSNLFSRSSAADDALTACTVTVLLWVAATAMPVRSVEGEGKTGRSTISPIRQTTLSPRCTSGSNCGHNSNHSDGLQLAEKHENSPVNENKCSDRSGDTTTTAAASLPACLCFSVRDIAKAESTDTNVMTTRERRVKRFTVMLESGALVYTARTTSDIFESVTLMNNNCSTNGNNGISTAVSGGTTSTTVTVAGTPSFASMADASHSSCVRLLPSGNLVCSFVFYQGGITRCVASLRRYSPKLIYTCLGLRHNSSNNSSSTALVAGGDGGTSPSGLSRDPSTHIGTQELYTVDINVNLSAEVIGNKGGRGKGVYGTLNALWKNYEGASLEARSSSGGPSKHSAVPQENQTHQTAKPSGGWRNCLSPAGLFQQKQHGVFSADRAQSPTHATLPTSPSFSVGGPIAMTMNNTKSGPAEEDAAGMKSRSGQNQQLQRAFTGDDSAGCNSSDSSFEDLTDEMTAVRLGTCYVPPKPSLPPVETDASAVARVTTVEWAAAFDAAPLKTLMTPATAAGTTTSPTALKGTTIGTGKVLHADRWCAFRQALFERGGLADPSIRFEVWCYLLGAYAVGSTESDQVAVLTKEAELYAHLTTQWKSFLPEQEEHFAVYRSAKDSILKDVERTDRTHPAFRDSNSDMLRVLRRLLLAHVMYNMDLGYSQGMSDVAAVASLVAPASNEAAMFLCLRRMLSEHMANNFVIEERKKDTPYTAVKGLQRKLYQVQVLTRHFHPRLYGHLKTCCMAEDMTFCFRWLLVCFKRDLRSIDDTMRFWDVLFACPYTKSYEVIVTVALFVALAPQIITHIHAYETLLQFMNMLSSSTTVDQILHCSRVFYENICVVETRELRRQHRHTITHAAAEARMSEPMPERVNNEGHANPAALPSSAAAGGTGGGEYFPTVEEMVSLFLETDGPL